MGGIIRSLGCERSGGIVNLVATPEVVTDVPVHDLGDTRRVVGTQHRMIEVVDDLEPQLFGADQLAQGAGRATPYPERLVAADDHEHVRSTVDEPFEHIDRRVTKPQAVEGRPDPVRECSQHGRGKTTTGHLLDPASRPLPQPTGGGADAAPAVEGGAETVEKMGLKAHTPCAPSDRPPYTA